MPLIAQTMPAVAITHRSDIIDRVAQGERLVDIAASYGVTYAAISLVLSKDPEYQDARQRGLDAKLEQRETELETAQDGLTIARARELLSHARWRAERLNPATYGQQRQSVQVNTDGPATINIVSWADSNSPDCDKDQTLDADT